MNIKLETKEHFGVSSLLYDRKSMPPTQKRSAANTGEGEEGGGDGEGEGEGERERGGRGRGGEGDLLSLSFSPFHSSLSQHCWSKNPPPADRFIPNNTHNNTFSYDYIPVLVAKKN